MLPYFTVDFFFFLGIELIWGVEFIWEHVHCPFLNGY